MTPNQIIRLVEAALELSGQAISIAEAMKSEITPEQLDDVESKLLQQMADIKALKL